MAWNEAKVVADAVDKFNESSTEISQKMIELAERMNFLTICILILTVAILILTGILTYKAFRS